MCCDIQMYSTIIIHVLSALRLVIRAKLCTRMSLVINEIDLYKSLSPKILFF